MELLELGTDALFRNTSKEIRMLEEKPQRDWFYPFHPASNFPREKENVYSPKYYSKTIYALRTGVRNAYSRSPGRWYLDPVPLCLIPRRCQGAWRDWWVYSGRMWGCWETRVFVAPLGSSWKSLCNKIVVL